MKTTTTNEYRSEHSICDLALCIAIGTGLAYVLQQWWFAA